MHDQVIPPLEPMDEMMLGLFTEVAIIEHLTRSRVERKFPDGLETGHFGLLNYFIRTHKRPDTIAGIAWAFQDEVDVVERRVRDLQKLGYLEVEEADSIEDSVVNVTNAGRQAQYEELTRMAPEFHELLSEIPREDLDLTYRTLREIRLTMDNLPDR